MQFDFLVTRRGLDPAAAACEHALRDLLHAPVLGVERGELWRLDAGPETIEPDAWRRKLQDAACRAGRYVNLNRDVCGFVADARPYPESAPRGAFAVDVWVRDGDGADPAALAWFRAQAGVPLADLRRGILWRLILTARDATAARELGLDLAVTRSRGHGLLCNPNAQTCEVRGVVAAPTGEGETP